MKWINESIEDFLAGYSKNRPYNEEIGQMYLEQLKAFKYKILNKKPLLAGSIRIYQQNFEAVFTQVYFQVFLFGDELFCLAPEALPTIAIDEPTMSMLFTINDSPFFGKDEHVHDFRRTDQCLCRQ